MALATAGASVAANWQWIQPVQETVLRNVRPVPPTGSPRLRSRSISSSILAGSTPTSSRLWRRVRRRCPAANSSARSAIRRPRAVETRALVGIPARTV